MCYYFLNSFIVAVWFPSGGDLLELVHFVSSTEQANHYQSQSWWTLTASRCITRLSSDPNPSKIIRLSLKRPHIHVLPGTEFVTQIYLILWPRCFLLQSWDAPAQTPFCTRIRSKQHDLSISPLTNGIRTRKSGLIEILIHSGPNRLSNVAYLQCPCQAKFNISIIT